ncbi:hypothetical protein SDC9_118756 [bioreactor metagenome]|uniref:Uncharacterized protein n=1 Tax=bioreactor metagenome TaxID=1076179 RepID=A0A645C2M7_9ZZZZ
MLVHHKVLGGVENRQFAVWQHKMFHLPIVVHTSSSRRSHQPARKPFFALLCVHQGRGERILPYQDIQGKTRILLNLLQAGYHRFEEPGVSTAVVSQIDDRLWYLILLNTLEDFFSEARHRQGWIVCAYIVLDEQDRLVFQKKGPVVGLGRSGRRRILCQDGKRSIGILFCFYGEQSNRSLFRLTKRDNRECHFVRWLFCNADIRIELGQIELPGKAVAKPNLIIVAEEGLCQCFHLLHRHTVDRNHFCTQIASRGSLHNAEVPRTSEIYHLCRNGMETLNKFLCQSNGGVTVLCKGSKSSEAKIQLGGIHAGSFSKRLLIEVLEGLLLPSLKEILVCGRQGGIQLVQISLIRMIDDSSGTAGKQHDNKQHGNQDMHRFHGNEYKNVLFLVPESSL